MVELAELIDGCTFVATGELPNDNHAFISPAPAIAVPDSVAAAGWVRDSEFGGPFSRNYVFDLQLGNIVVRTRLVTHKEVTEVEFRAFVERFAEQLAAALPLGPPAG